MGALHRDDGSENLPALGQGNWTLRVQSLWCARHLHSRAVCRCLHGLEVSQTLGFICKSYLFYSELYEKDFDGQHAIYWEVKYPFPLSNRDYVYVRERKDLDVDGRKIWVILARSSPETACAEKSGVLRVKDYKQSVALESDGGCGTRVFLNYFDNPGGMIPTWLVNWAAKSGVPGFLTDMQKACSNYGSYCQKK
ncbi:phosphatidylcholine transfer protein isoform X2 [Acanthopagrus latus]|uniref:phosphatidylcholine transfer protein isoform X2 n=1 Tax=Acanthopagrus latus TaxID=8177 RepID=UPI00187BCE12|nr:phosphatidylcholine transfer protein isoform X2 [Acanthopagrus latus]